MGVAGGLGKAVTGGAGQGVVDCGGRVRRTRERSRSGCAACNLPVSPGRMARRGNRPCFPPALRGLSPSTPWAFPQHSVGFPPALRGLSPSTPWAFPQHSVGFPPALRGLSPSTPCVSQSRDLATPMAGMSVRIPRWQAGPKRRGWAIPWPSQCSRSGACCKHSRTARRTGISRKESNPGM